MQADFFLKKAQVFGSALDRDDFVAAKKLLAENCEYDIGEKIILGAAAIVNSYEVNMIEGRNKLDELVWGKSKAELLKDGRVAVVFTDYLKHKEKKHTHRCRQLLSFNEAGEVVHIEHQNLPGEPERLKAYFLSVGLG